MISLTVYSWKGKSVCISRMEPQNYSRQGNSGIREYVLIGTHSQILCSEMGNSYDGQGASSIGTMYCMGEIIIDLE